MPNRNEQELLERVTSAIGTPPEDVLVHSRRRVKDWFARTAPLIQWDVVESPLGSIYIAASAQGVCSVKFGVGLEAFLSELDPLAHTDWNPTALVAVTRQLCEYFDGERSRFDLPVDLSRATPFQQRVLQTTRCIPKGTVWTYGQIARTIGKPKASRAVGQALGHNPVPIVIPCHRVIASDGTLGGYSGGGGLDHKRLLLHLEGAL